MPAAAQGSACDDQPRYGPAPRPMGGGRGGDELRAEHVGSPQAYAGAAYGVAVLGEGAIHLGPVFA